MIRSKSTSTSKNKLPNLSRLIQDGNSMERHIYFIYSYCLNYNYFFQYLNQNPVGSSSMAEDLDKAIGSLQGKNANDFIESVRNVIGLNLLADIYFKSINEKSIRMTRYILSKINSNQAVIQYFNAGFNNSLRSRIPTDIGKIMFSIDVVGIHIQEKEQIINTALNDWTNHLNFFKKDYDWFLDEKYKLSRVEFALDWIQNKMNFKSAVFSEHHLPDETTKLMIILDELFSSYLTINNIYALKLQLGELKKYWSQYNYRESLKNGKKKQCNIILSNKAISELDNLSEKYVMSRAKIIEKLIRKEIECGIYLDEK